MRIIIVALSFTAAVMGLAAPLFQKVFVDRLLMAPATQALTATLGPVLGSWILGLSTVALIAFAALAALLGSGLSMLTGYTAVLEGIRLQGEISEMLYRKMLGLRAEAMSGTTVGEVVSIYATDVPGSTALIDQAIPLGSGIFFPLLFAPLAIHWIVGIPIWATVTVIAVVTALNSYLGIRQSRFFYFFKQLAAERTGIVNEWVQHIRLLRILGWMEKFEAKIFKKREEETVNRIRMLSNGQVMGSIGTTINFVINITAVGSLIFFKRNVVTPGELFALLWILAVFLARPFRQIPWIFTFSFDSLTSVRRIESFLARPSDSDESFEESKSADEESDEVSNAVLNSAAATLEVSGLQLVINGQTRLRDIDLNIKPGEFVAIIGEVGSGKSLLMLSLVGETGATFNEFKIAGRSVLGQSLNERRRLFSFVAQDGFVMSSSLRENLEFRYDVKNDRDEKLLQSLEAAQMSYDVASLSDGLDTEIGERGVNLSGGQKQRVAIARAHYLARPIVLLDDSLSAVDVETERALVSRLLQGDWRSQTRILVTHRLSVLPLADTVIMMHQGRIVARGKFADLVQSSPDVREFVASVKAAQIKAQGELTLG